LELGKSDFRAKTTFPQRGSGEEKPGFWPKNLPWKKAFVRKFEKCHFGGLALVTFHDHRPTANFDQKVAKKGGILAPFFGPTPKNTIFVPWKKAFFFTLFRARNSDFGPKIPNSALKSMIYELFP
jgi:hypothetical protein